MTVSIVVCDGDELARRAVGQLVIEHGFEVVAEATMAVEAVQLCQIFHASVVVLGNELQGLSGLEVVPELEEAGVRVILISNDDEALVRARDAGAFFAVARGDLDMLDRALAAIGEAASGDDRRSGIDRRRGIDRRVQTDWTKVTRERRNGADRRRAERRQGEAAGSGRQPGHQRVASGAARARRRARRRPRSTMHRPTQRGGQRGRDRHPDGGATRGQGTSHVQRGLGLQPLQLESVGSSGRPCGGRRVEGRFERSRRFGVGAATAPGPGPNRASTGAGPSSSAFR